MDDLATYIINYYFYLLTPEEQAAHFTILGKYKIEHSPDKKGTSLWQSWVSTDPKVMALLADGVEAFHARVRERVLRERRAEIFLNYCPRCGALTKTPTAKQCPKCFFSWHDDA